MICYQHPTISAPPAWLVGAADLCSGEAMGGVIHAVGESYLLRLPLPGEPAPVALADGWMCWVVGEFDPSRLVRAQGWARLDSASDSDDRAWPSPIILDADGARCFVVRYGGADWTPILSPVQVEAEHVARIARDALAAARATGEIDPSAAAAWASRLYSVALHVNPQVLAILGLMDLHAVLGCLSLATGIQARPAETDHG